MTANSPLTALVEKQSMTLNRAKIVATLGPASSSDDVVEQLILTGMNVARINMSHGSHETHRENIQRVRRIAEKHRISVGILADLQGPKLRIGQFENDEPIFLEQGQVVTLKACDERGHQHFITTPSVPLLNALQVSDLVLINDGAIRLQVQERLDDITITAHVLQGGKLSERKGINVPDTNLTFSALTDKDKEDALFALKQGADFIALSFVRTAQDIYDLQTFMADNGFKPAPIIAKIEKPKALERIDEILDACFGLMVARGDLGVEIPAARVPVVQKQLIEKATQVQKPVIVATQMLESMIYSATPSRAEVSDVANAVFDGADAVMLSAESAAGSFPVEAVQMMRQIIVEAEKHYSTHQYTATRSTNTAPLLAHQTIANAVSYAAIKSDVKAIVVMSDSGSMAQRVSKLKPLRPIICLTESQQTYQRVSLLWGVTPLVIRFGETTEEVLNNGEAAIIQHKLLAIGDETLFCAGQTAILGATNMLKFFTMGQTIRSAIGLI